jgi:hypothetical protein
MPSGVSQTGLNGSFRNLLTIRAGKLSRNANSQASNHEIGIESSHPSHCARDIPSSRRSASVAGIIRSANVGSSLSIWA